MPRTGSNHLCALLHSHPEVVCHTELFHKSGAFGAQDLPVFSDMALRTEDPVHWLELVVEASAASNPNCRMVGFKLHLTQNIVVLEHLLRAHDMPILLLERRNKLAQFASLERAERTRRYTSLALPRWQEPDVRFDSERFGDFVARQALGYNLVRLLVDRPERIMELDYTEVLDEGMQVRIQRFLGLSPEPLTSREQRLGVTRIRDRFVDPEQVEASLRYSVWRPWLDDDGG